MGVARTIRRASLAGATLALLASVAVVPTARAEDLRLPAPDFLPCAGPDDYFCVEAVTFTKVGSAPQVATWKPSGTVDVSDDTSILPPALQPVSATRSFPGRWTFDGFDVEQFGYDGIYVQVGPSSQGADVAWVRFQPATAREDASVGLAVAAEGSTAPRNLDASTRLTAVVRFGPLEPTANVIVGNGSMRNIGTAEANTLTFTGYPVTVPQQTSTRDCEGESGVARATPSQLYAFVFFGNTRQAFGYDGMSGRLTVSSNGTCRISTPVYDPQDGSFTFTAAAPHFAADGTTINRGFYSAFIPMQDAGILFGITNPKEVKTALIVSVENENGEDVPVTYSVSARKGAITVSYTGFTFSVKKVTVRVKPALWRSTYKKAAEKARAAARG